MFKKTAILLATSAYTAQKNDIVGEHHVIARLDDPSGLSIVTYEGNDSIIDMFVGSDESMDWVTNFKFRTDDWFGIEAHRGYVNLMKDESIENHFDRAHDAAINPDLPRWVGGHSAGGPLSQLQYLKCPSMYEGGRTFASPKAFKGIVNYKEFPFINYLNVIDPVVHVVPGRTRIGVNEWDFRFGHRMKYYALRK